MTRCGSVAGIGAGVLLAGCGGAASPPAAGSSSSSSMSSSTGMEMSENTSCAPSGTRLTLVAKDTRFATECLAAPAGQAVTIRLDNQDALPHNLSIFSADPDRDRNAKELFKGDIITGRRPIDYQVPAQPAGTYHFHCAVHPTQMHGTYVVK